MHTAETMDEVFEQVGEPVLVLHPDDANTVSTEIPPGDNERPTIWSLAELRQS